MDAYGAGHDLQAQDAQRRAPVGPAEGGAPEVTIETGAPAVLPSPADAPALSKPRLGAPVVVPRKLLERPGLRSRFLVGSPRIFEGSRT